MTMRTSEKTVTFRRPFVVGGFDEVLPAGAYSVETDEELLEGISFAAYRRTSTLIHLHAKPSRPGLTWILSVDPNELDAALRREQASAEIGLDRDAGHGTPRGTLESRRAEADNLAMERSEDEGMKAQPR